jgi:hypothetical protein
MSKRFDKDGCLTDKQMEYCRLVAIGRTGMEAYMEAYGVTNKKSASTGSNKLMNDERIKEELERLNKKARAMHEKRVYNGMWSKLDRMQRLQGWAEDAAGEGKYGDAIRAVAEINRMDGAYEPDKVQVGLTGTFSAVMERIMSRNEQVEE